MDDQREPNTQRFKQFLEAVDQLTPEEQSALRLCSHRLLPGTPFDSADDLIHEAIHSVVTGSREWRQSVDTAVFLYQAMRSIASIPRRVHAKADGPREVSYEDWSLEDQEPHHRLANRSPEEILMLREEAAAALALRDHALGILAGDSDAAAILEARCEDESGTDIRKRLGLPEREFKAADERARRAMRIAKRGNRP